jgi:hypothetical protein
LFPTLTVACEVDDEIRRFRLDRRNRGFGFVGPFGDLHQKGRLGAMLGVGHLNALEHLETIGIEEEGMLAESPGQVLGGGIVRRQRLGAGTGLDRGKLPFV